MTDPPGEQPIEEQLQRLHKELDAHKAIDRAIELLVGSYQLTTAQATDFLQKKAREDARETADVAEEILDNYGPPRRR